MVWIARHATQAMVYVFAIQCEDGEMRTYVYKGHLFKLYHNMIRVVLDL